MNIEKKFAYKAVISLGVILLMFLLASEFISEKPQAPEKNLIQGPVTEIFPEKNMIRVYDAKKGAVYSVTVSPEQLSKENPSSIKLMDTVTITTSEDTSATQIVKAESVTRNVPTPLPGIIAMPAELTNKGAPTPPPGTVVMPAGTNFNFSF